MWTNKQESSRKASAQNKDKLHKKQKTDIIQGTEKNHNKQQYPLISALRESHKGRASVKEEHDAMKFEKSKNRVFGDGKIVIKTSS